MKNQQNISQQNEENSGLSGEEIKQKIAEADQNPNNISFQKNLGIALYRYASMKQDVELMSEISRLLLRVHADNPNDSDVTVTLGNIFFDIGYLKKDNENLFKAREYYQKLLGQKPNDANVRTDFGLTYFLTDPPETDKAILEFNKSLAIDAKHEKTLQVLTQALISQNKNAEAKQYFEQLKRVNPENQFLQEFVEQLKDK